MRALVLLCLLALPAPALAGAWARGEGEAFVSLKGSVVPGESEALDPTFALYGEYGLTPRLTLGASYDKLDPPFSLAKAFARWNLTAPEATWQIAVEGGAGVEFDDTGIWPDASSFFPYFAPPPPAAPPQAYFDPQGSLVTLPAGTEIIPPGYTPAPAREVEPAPKEPARKTLVAAIHAGRGFETPFGNAWVDARLGLDIPLEERPTLYKLDVVGGLSVTERGFVSLEMRLARSEGYHGLVAVPSVGYEVRSGLQATLGAVVDLRSGDPTRIEIGTWVSF